MGQLPWDDVAVLIEPRETVAPVGSEVVLIAGVLGPDGYLRTNRRLEWSVAPGSVGEFVAVEQGRHLDLLLGDFNWPRKINATTAVGSTSRSNVRLNRGTGTPEDDKFVRPRPRLDHAHLAAGRHQPRHRGSARGVQLGRPHQVGHGSLGGCRGAISAAGDQSGGHEARIHHHGDAALEPVAVRELDRSVRNRRRSAGRLSRPSDAVATEVRTNSAGQACAEIVQKQPASGVNKICIQVIRPADAPGAGGQRLVVGNGTTTKTWSAPDLAVRVTGPATGSIGATLTYQIELSNPGDLAAKDVTAVVDVPDGLTYLGGNPAAEVAGRQLRWRLGDLGARQRRPIEVGFPRRKARQRGRLAVMRRRPAD